MREKSEYHSMSNEDLKTELLYLEELLVEVEEERKMMLGQTGHHIPSTFLAKEYRTEMQDIADRINTIKSML